MKQFLKVKNVGSQKLAQDKTFPGLEVPQQEAQPLRPGWQGPFGRESMWTPAQGLQPCKCCQPCRRGSCSSWKAGPAAKWMGRELAGNQQVSGKNLTSLGSTRFLF